MEQLDLDDYDILVPISHYKNLKTEVIDDKSQKHSIERLDYSKINCSTKDLLKEKDKKIEILQEQMLQLQKRLEQQKPNNNYKSFNANNSNSANNINYTNLNCNTSTNFPLKNEIKKIWEELALVSLLDNFIDYEKQPEIIFHFVSELVLITDKLISDLCLDMYQKVSQSLNIINDKKFINDIEKTSRPLIKEHLNKTFAGTNNQQFIDKVVNLFKTSVKKIYGEEGGEGSGGYEIDRIGEVAEGSDFKLMIKKIKDILLFTKFNDQQLFFRIEKDYNKRIVERIKIKNNFDKKNYLIINDNNKEDIEAVIILKPPVLRSGFPLNNDFKTIIIIYEKEGNSKSYKNLPNINSINHIDNNNNSKINKIVGLQIKKISPCFKSMNNNIEIKTDEYNNYNNRINKLDNNNNNKIIQNEEIINTVFSKEQRNSFQKLSKNMNLNIKHKEDINNYKTDFNQQKEVRTINQDNNEENNRLLHINSNTNTNRYKNINKIKKKDNFSNDNRLNEKRNITTNKKHRPQLSDQILKNNSSKNLFDYNHKDLMNNSSSKKYQNIQKEANNSFNQNHFITYNNNDMKSMISLNNNTDNENYDEIDNEEINNKEIIFHTNTAKGVFNVQGNLNLNINNENKKQRNTNNGENINKLNQIYFNQNDSNIILNNKEKAIYSQLKEKINSKNSLNKLNVRNNRKNMMNMKENNKIYKKINEQKQKKNNNNQIQKNNNKDYYNNNNIYKESNNNDNEYYNKMRMTGVEIYNNDLRYSNVGINSNIYNQYNNINDDNNYNDININDQFGQDVMMFKKHNTANLIGSKIKNNKNDKKNFKIIPLIKMKTQQYQNQNQEFTNTYNINNTNTKTNNNINYNQNQNRRSSNKIKNNKQAQNANNKMIQIENSNDVCDNYRKIRNKKNINNYFVDNGNGNNNNVLHDNSKKKFNFNLDKKNNNTTNNIGSKNNENMQGKKMFSENNKYTNYKMDKNQKINNITSNKEKNKKYKKENANYQGIRNNNLFEQNNNDYNEINNTGYKIKNVNINYFNIMQPNKLYINQNSTRSKSRPSDCERNKILINYNNYNKNIIQNSNQNNNNKIIKNMTYKNNENNFNNNRLLFNRVNNKINKKKNSSQENSSRINIKNNINNINNINSLNIYSNNRTNKVNNYHYKLNLVKNNTNTKIDSYNINKNPLSIITDLTNIDKITEQIKHEKRVLIKIKAHKNNKVSGLKEEKFNSENNHEKNYEEKNSLTIGDINNHSSNNTSRKKNKCQIMNNKHTSYVKIPKKMKKNEVRPASGGVRYIEKNYNKFDSEYINRINSNFNNNNDELNEMRESYIMPENERNSFKSRENKISKQNKMKDNNINYYDNKGNFQNNKNTYGFNGMSTYNYNSFRKNNKFN